MDIVNISKKLLYKNAFYGHFALSVEKKISDKVDTACVHFNGINMEMHFNPTFTSKLTEKQQIGLMEHELGHILFFHLLYSENYKNKDAYNIACDMVINQYIDPDYLPPHPCLPSSFPELKLEAFKDANYYYNAIIKDQDESPRLKKLLSHMASGGKTLFSHELWSDSNISPQISNLIKKQIEHQIKDVYENNLQKNTGAIPGFLRKFVLDLYIKEKPITNWRTVVNNFTSFCDDQTVRVTKNRLNKRFEDFEAITLKRKKTILIGVDTSGSISDVELQKFFQQILHIHKAGSEIDICEWDVGIQRIYKFDKNKIIKNKSNNICGGGGTNPLKVIEELNKNKQYTGAIMFSDGHIGGEWLKKVSKPILWIITKSGNLDFKFPGKKVKAID